MIKVIGKRIDGIEYSCLLVRNGHQVRKREWNQLFPDSVDFIDALETLKKELQAA